MIYRQTVLDALEHHVNRYPGACDSCPYKTDEVGKRFTCSDQLLSDVQALLLAEDIVGSRVLSVHGANLHLLKD